MEESKQNVVHLLSPAFCSLEQALENERAEAIIKTKKQRELTPLLIPGQQIALL